MSSSARPRFRLRCLHRSIALLLAGASTLSVAANVPDNSTAPLGINISTITYWSSEWPVVDEMKRSNKWLTQCDTRNSPACTAAIWDTGEQSRLDLDAHGWVRSLPATNDPAVRYRTIATLMLQGDGGYHPAGQYIVLYDGEGTLDYQFDASRNAALSTPGRDVLDVKAGTLGILLKITATDPRRTGNYLRNIRVIRPGGVCNDDPFAYAEDASVCQARGERYTPFVERYASEPFHPLFLHDLRPFRVIRFMDFLNTNNSTLQSWAQRPRLEDARWTGPGGAPLELALDLAVRLNADPWLNIPIQADNDYVQRSARLAHERLRPGQRVYVEYGNEVWNDLFSAGAWVQQQAVKRWPDQPGGPSPYTRRANWYGMRAAEICRLWKREWGTDRAQVQCVIGGAPTNTWINEQMLACPLVAAENGGRTCAEGMTALAVAPYFGSHLGLSRNAPTVATWTEQSDGGLLSLFQELARGDVLNAPGGLSLPAVYGYIDRQRILAERYRLVLVAYEGGQHVAGVGNVQNDARMEKLFTSANRDPQMGALYLDYLNGWRQHGGQLFVHFNSVGRYGKFGSWGAKEYQTQTSAPKYDALLRFIADNPCWWDGCVATTTGAGQP